MDPKQKNSLVAAGIVSGLVSLPMTWMTIRNAQIQFEGGLGGLFNHSFPGMTIDVTGLNGHVTMLFKTPLWFVVLVAIAANVLQIMKSSKAFAIPKTAQWTIAIASAVWIAIPALLAVSSGNATLGIGWFLGVCCAAAPLICLFAPDSISMNSTAEPKHDASSRDA